MYVYYSLAHTFQLKTKLNWLYYIYILLAFRFYALADTNLKKMKKPFTEQEQEIMDLLVKAHNKFVEMEQMHPDDIREWIDGIHKCQNVLKGRVVTRDYPDIFYNSALANES